MKAAAAVIVTVRSVDSASGSAPSLSGDAVTGSHLGATDSVADSAGIGAAVTSTAAKSGP